MKLPTTSCSLLNHPNSFHGRMFKLKAKFDADSLLYLFSHFEYISHTVHMLTQWHLSPPLTSTMKSLLFKCVNLHLIIIGFIGLKISENVIFLSQKKCKPGGKFPHIYGNQECMVSVINIYISVYYIYISTNIYIIIYTYVFNPTSCYLLIFIFHCFYFLICLVFCYTLIMKGSSII